MKYGTGDLKGVAVAFAPGGIAMAICAKVGFFENRFLAALSNGRHIDQADFRDMAYALYGAGVQANDVQYEWCAGQRMITAGQQVALCAEIRRLEREYDGRLVAAA